MRDSSFLLIFEQDQLGQVPDELLKSGCFNTSLQNSIASATESI